MEAKHDPLFLDLFAIYTSCFIRVIICHIRFGAGPTRRVSKETKFSLKKLKYAMLNSKTTPSTPLFTDILRLIFVIVEELVRGKE
jgi:hypothetical protein